MYAIRSYYGLEGNLRRQVYVDFEETGTHAFFECGEGLGIVDTSAPAVSIVPVRGTVIAVGTDAGTGLFTALTQDGQDCELVAIERPRYLVARTRTERGRGRRAARRALSLPRITSYNVCYTKLLRSTPLMSIRESIESVPR